MAIQIGGGSTCRRGLRVLVVGDERDTTDTLVGIVQRLGYAARVAHDGFAEPVVPAAQDADVVLLNMESPRFDGCRIAAHLRMHLPRNECFIMAVIERADDQRRHQCFAAGIDVLLVQPVDPEVVETLLLLESVHANRRRRLGSGAGRHT